MRRHFTWLLAAGFSLAFIPCGILEAVEFQDLPKALRWGHEVHEADWNQILNDRIKAGEPMPEWSGPDEKFLPRGKRSSRISSLPDLPDLPLDDREEAREKRAGIYLHSGLLREEVIADGLNAGWEQFADSDRPDPTLDALRIREPAEAARIFKIYMDGADRDLAVIGAKLMMEMEPREDHCRQKLIAAVSDASIAESVRGIAVEGLLDKPWDGMESWILASIGQEAPLRGGWFFGKIRDMPDHWIPLLTKRLDEGGNARTTAVELLVLFGRADSIRPLLPWLKNRDWCAASEGTFRDLIESLGKLDVPECAEDLMKLANESSSFEFKIAAATTLACYKKVEAVSYLKKVLTELGDGESYYRAQVIESIQKLGGFAPSEIVPALEAYFTAFPDTGGHPDRSGESDSVRSAGQSADPSVRNGACFAVLLPQTPELLAAIELRAKTVAKKNPVLARNFRELAAQHFVAAAGRILAEELAEERLGERGLVLGLMHRRDKNPLWDGNGFRKLAGKPGTLGGLAAALSGDPALMNAVLARKGNSSRLAVLASASFTGDPLDLQQVRNICEGEDKTLADVALTYLGTRADLPALALGDELAKARAPEHLSASGPNRDLVRLTSGITDPPTEVMSLARIIQGIETSRLSILCYPGRAFGIQSFREGRRGICELNAAQIERLKSYVTRYRIDDLPSMGTSVFDGHLYQFAHITSGRMRFFSMDNPPRSLSEFRELNDRKYSEGTVVYAELVNHFEQLFSELDLKFSRGEGIEILVSRERGNIKAVWKKGGDLRVFVNPPSGSGPGFWQAVDAKSGKFLGAVEEPPEVPMLETMPQMFPGFENESIPPIYPWQVRRGDSLIHAGKFNDVDGLWFCRRGKDPELLMKGFFHGERVSEDGKWCLVARRSGRDPSAASEVIRIDLESKETFPVNLQDAGSFRPLAFISGTGKFLIRRARAMYPIPGREPIGPRAAEYYLVDPATGAPQLVKGDFIPLKEKLSRPFQITTDPLVGWTTKAEDYITGALTRVGLYDSGNFKFKTVCEIKGIAFESTDMWVDEEEGMIYAAADGDLVKIPLKAK